MSMAFLNIDVRLLCDNELLRDKISPISYFLSTAHLIVHSTHDAYNLRSIMKGIFLLSPGPDSPMTKL
ncbi:hypothetical protein X975_05319, partial [Stegodyphus mimosarum]